MSKDRVNLRLLEMAQPFSEYVENNNIKRSEAIRHFIKNGIREGAVFSVTEKAELKVSIIDAISSHRRVGGNLNQIAKEANQRGYILENTLAGTLNETLESQKEITDLLNTLLKKI